VECAELRRHGVGEVALDEEPIGCSASSDGEDVLRCVKGRRLDERLEAMEQRMSQQRLATY